MTRTTSTTGTTGTDTPITASSARRRLGRVGALALTAVLALSTAGCGGHDGTHSAAKGTSTSSAVPASEPFNTADVTFATDMIQHHAQALAMVDLTQGRTLSAATASLVEAIRDAQTPEIETMTGWLQRWDRPVPATVRDHVHGEAGGGVRGVVMWEATVCNGDVRGIDVPECKVYGGGARGG